MLRYLLTFSFLLIVASYNLSGNRYPAFVSVTNVCPLSNSPVALDDGVPTPMDGLLVFGEFTMLLIVT